MEEMDRAFKSPAAVGAARARLFRFSVPIRHDERLAAVSYLRAAYLTVFARWGYRQVLSPSYQLLRRQLRDFDQQVLPWLPVGHGATPGNTLYIGHHVAVGRAFIVMFRDRWAALPVGTHDVGFWDRLASAVETHPNAAFAPVQHFEWPTAPQHISDLTFPLPNTGTWERLDMFGDTNQTAA